MNDRKAIQVEIQRSASDSSVKKTSAKRVERKHLKVNKNSLTELLILNERTHKSLLSSHGDAYELTLIV